MSTQIAVADLRPHLDAAMKRWRELHHPDDPSATGMGALASTGLAERTLRRILNQRVHVPLDQAELLLKACDVELGDVLPWAGDVDAVAYSDDVLHVEDRWSFWSPA